MNAQDKAQNLIAKFRKAGCASFPEAEVHSAISSAKICCDELIDQCETESDQQYWRSVKEVLAGPHFKLPTVQPSIPAHIVDDMKLDSYYDGFKDGQAMAGKPNNRADGTGPEFYCQRYFEENPLCENQCDHCKAYYEPLTVQPDKPEDKTPRQIADEKYGNDPMYQLIALQLDIALDGAQKKVKDPTKYILDELRKRGFEVIKPSPQTGEKEPPQWKLWEEVVYCVLTNNKDGAKEQLTKNYHITPIKK